MFTASKLEAKHGQRQDQYRFSGSSPCFWYDTSPLLNNYCFVLIHTYILAIINFNKVTHARMLFIIPIIMISSHKTLLKWAHIYVYHACSQRCLLDYEVMRAYMILCAGSILLGMNPTEAQVCGQICFNAAYMTCPSSGNTHLSPKCNCCEAPEVGCSLYNSDGTRICTRTRKF